MTTEARPAPTRAADFAGEFGDYWRRLPDKPLFLALLIAWGALFHWFGHCSFNFTDQPSLFAWMWGAWSAAALESEHAKLIPPVVLLLLWLRRRELFALPTAPWWPALAGLALTLAVHIIGYIVQQPRVSMVTLFGGIYCFVGLVWGWRWMRASFFPFALLAFCVPLESFGEGFLFQLRLLVTKLSVFLGHDVLGLDVVREGTRVFNSTRTFNYDVAPACSGIRSLASLLAVMTIYGCVVFRTLWKRGLMVLLAAPLAVAGNVARITTVILIGDAFGQSAGAKVEEHLGFVTFAVAIAVMLAVGWWLREPTTTAPAEASGAAPENSASAPAPGGAA